MGKKMAQTTVQSSVAGLAFFRFRYFSNLGVGGDRDGVGPLFSGGNGGRPLFRTEAQHVAVRATDEAKVVSLAVVPLCLSEGTARPRRGTGGRKVHGDGAGL